MPNGKHVTGLSGKNWMSELGNKRVVWLSHELQKSGRGLTWDELRKKVMKELPGGQTIAERLVKKVAYGVEQNVFPTTLDEAWNIMLPQGPANMRRWEEEREKKRTRFINQQKSRDAYNERQTKKTKSDKALEEKETSVENIRQTLGKLPKEVEGFIDQLKTVMRANNFRKLEVDLRDDGKAHVELEPVPQSIITVV